MQDIWAGYTLVLLFKDQTCPKAAGGVNTVTLCLAAMLKVKFYSGAFIVDAIW